jgi:hypothetical protein
VHLLVHEKFPKITGQKMSKKCSIVSLGNLAIGCRISSKVHFLSRHLDFFPPDGGAVSDEHGERFHQDISNMESRYKEKSGASMMADFVWSVTRETSNTHHKKAKYN